jgi:hypothetical protein
MFDQVALEPEKILFREFKILRGNINSPLEFKQKRIKSYKSDVAFDMAFQLEKNMIKSEIEIKAKTISDGKNKAEADGFFHIAFFFEIEHLEQYVLEVAPKQMHIHPGMANAIASISYSTARGIILSRFQGTALSAFILPVINPNDLFNTQTVE